MGGEILTLLCVLIFCAVGWFSYREGAKAAHRENQQHQQQSKSGEYRECGGEPIYLGLKCDRHHQPKFRAYGDSDIPEQQVGDQLRDVLECDVPEVVGDDQRGDYLRESCCRIKVHATELTEAGAEPSAREIVRLNPLSSEQVNEYAVKLRFLLLSLDREVVATALIRDSQSDLLHTVCELVDSVSEFLHGGVGVALQTDSYRSRGLALLDSFSDKLLSTEHGVSLD